jgi:hypothetical protein
MPSWTRIITAAGLTAATAGLLAAGGSPAAPPAATQAAAGSTCSTTFVASVRHGPRAGTDYAGVLTLQLDEHGRFRHGSFHALKGGRVDVQGASHGRAISLRLRTRGGTLRGTGSIDGSLKHCVGRMQGRLTGPGHRDRGDWLATTGQSISLPGDFYMFTSAETANHPNPQVVYRYQGLTGPGGVFAGALNTPGNVDGQRLAARMNRPSGLAYDAAKACVYVADVANASVRRLDMSTNQVTTMLRATDMVAAAHAAGYPSVTGWEPQGVVVQSGGAVLITDVRNNVVWRYNPATSQLKLFAGAPGSVGSADGSDAAVRFNGPQQIVVQSNGVLIVAEPTKSRIRLRDPTAPNGSWSTIAN